MNEIWKPIIGYEDRYEVSNTGKVKVIKSRKNACNKELVGEVYTASQTQYHRVLLSNPKKRFLVHRLVAMHFLGPIEGCNIVNHLDNDGLNNNVDNLEWTTYSGNLLHAQKQGRLTEAQSKGGSVTSAQNKEKASKAASGMVGSVYGSWTALEHVENKVGQAVRDSLLCECSCGTRLTIYYTHLSRGVTTNCKACGRRKVSQDRVKTIQKEYSGCVLGTWKCTGELVGYKPEHTTKQVKFEVECVKCGHTDNIPYSKISVGVKRCLNCND